MPPLSSNLCLWALNSSISSQFITSPTNKQLLITSLKHPHFQPCQNCFWNFSRSIKNHFPWIFIFLKEATRSKRLVFRREAMPFEAVRSCLRQCLVGSCCIIMIRESRVVEMKMNMYFPQQVEPQSTILAQKVIWKMHIFQRYNFCFD